MHVGITYDLKSEYLANGYTPEEVAEFDNIDTIEGIENALHSNGYDTERIGNVRKLISDINAGKKWDLVFNICEGLNGIGREAQVPAVLDIYNIPYTFSDVLVLSMTLHKGIAKRVIRDMGIPTADFFIVESAEDIDKVKLPFPLFAKPVAEGTGKGVTQNSKINNKEELRDSCLEKLRDFNQPVLVETFLPGREFTVGIVGNGSDAQTVGIMEVIYRENEKSKVYSYFNKANYKDFIDYSVPDKEVAELCYKVALYSWKGLGCFDAGRIDLRMDEKGIPNFIEVNPLAGLNLVHSDLPILAYKQGYTYNQLIGMIMKAAIKRIFPASKKQT